MRKIAIFVVLAVALCGTIALGMTNVILCSEHGVKAVYTGNRKLIGKKWYCEYSHPTRLGSHKIWSECD
jgi:hypothetical protein